MIYKLEDKDFYQWLAGFWEGEGSFCIVKHNNKKNFRFIFQISQDNIGPLIYIKNKLSTGHIATSTTLEKKHYNFRICKQDEIIRIINYILPFLVFKKDIVLEKLDRLRKYKEYMKEKYKLKNQIKLINIDN